MSVTAKLKLTHITETCWGPPGSKILKFNAQYDTSIPEDRRFQKATPNADATFTVDNPTALEQFKLGEDYYVTFDPAPKKDS
jgi:hypothetical protein